MKTKDLTGISILAALIVVLQLFATFIPLPVANPNLTLIPIVIGGALYGRRAGAMLGGIMACVILATYMAGSVGLGPVIMQKMPLATVAVTLIRGILTGFIPAAIYKLIRGKNQTLAAIISSLLCPVINTGVYCLGVLFVFKDVFVDFKGGGDVYVLLFTAVLLTNFAVEFVLNAVLSPAILRVIRFRNTGK